MGEWEGAYSDNHSSWTESLMQQINPVFGDDGTFWMCYEDFTKFFKSLNVCKVRPDDEALRVKGEFEKGYNKGQNRA